MAVIYLPKNNQPQEFGANMANIIGNVLGSMDTTKRVQAIQEAAAAGAPPEALMGAAGNNKDAQAIATKLVAQKFQQTEIQQQQKRDENTNYNQQYMQGLDTQNLAINQQKAADEHTLLPLRMQSEQAQIGLAKANASKIPSEIAAAQAAVAASNMNILESQDRMNTSRQLLTSILNPGGAGAATDDGSGGGEQAQGYTPYSATPSGGSNPTQPSPIRGGPISFGGSPPQQVMPTNGPGLGDMSPVDKVRLYLASKEGKGSPAAMSSVLKDIEKTKAKDAATTAGTKPLPMPALMPVQGAAAYHSDMNHILDALPNTDTGNFWGRVTAITSKIGIDPSVIGLTAAQGVSRDMMNEGIENAIKNGATTGGGFLSKERVDLNTAILPSFVKGKVTNLMSSFVYESALLDQLTSLRKNFAKGGYNLESVDDQIAASKQIIERISKFQYDEKTGALIDGQRLEAKIPAKGYPTLDGKDTVTRDQVIAAMKHKPQLGMDQIIQILVANGKGTADDSSGVKNRAAQ